MWKWINDKERNCVIKTYWLLWRLWETYLDDSYFRHESRRGRAGASSALFTLKAFSAYDLSRSLKHRKLAHTTGTKAFYLTSAFSDLNMLFLFCVMRKKPAAFTRVQIADLYRGFTPASHHPDQWWCGKCQHRAPKVSTARSAPALTSQELLRNVRAGWK